MKKIILALSLMFLTACSSEDYAFGSNYPQRFLNREGLQEGQQFNYTLVETLYPDSWTLGGEWLVEGNRITAMTDGATLKIKLSPKNLYLQMGSDTEKAVLIILNGEELQEFIVKDEKKYKIIEASKVMRDAEIELVFDQGIRVSSMKIEK